MFRFALIAFLFLFNFSSYGEESSLTFKQQLDRLQREVNDLSKLVFQKNIRDIDNSNKIESENSMNVAAFDMRIYDLEKDIKTLNSNLEETIFQIDELERLFEELNIKFEELTIKIDANLINKSQNTETSQISSNEINSEVKEDNTLGTLKINSEDLSDISSEEDNDQLNSEISKIEPELQFQMAFDLLRSQKFEQAKKALKEFIDNNGDNELAGSSYYWLGEIHLLKKDYREAALVFAEGYQKYPSSVKAPDSLYKLAESLSQIDKTNDACNTLRRFLKEYTNHRLIDKTNKKIKELNCK